MSKIRIAAALLLVITAILHLVQPLLYGINSMIGYMIFGVIYLLLGVLLIFIKRNWIVWACILVPTVGLISSLYENIQSLTMLPIYPLLAAIDIAVVVSCWMELKR